VGAVTAGGKPALLFLSPLMPAEGGNGLAMRAGATLEALAADYDVHLLVIPLAGPAEPPGEAVRRWCARILVHPADLHVDQKCSTAVAFTGSARSSNHGSLASGGNLTGCHSGMSVSCSRTPWRARCLTNSRVWRS
jgi:hypothetical protein